MGLDVTFTLGADGAAEMNTNGDVDSIHCAMQDGVLMADGISFTLQDALLTVSMDGVTMTFSREKPEASARPSRASTKAPLSTISGASGRLRASQRTASHCPLKPLKWRGIRWSFTALPVT